MERQFICLEAPSVCALFQLVSKINLLSLILDACLLIFAIFHTSAIWANYSQFYLEGLFV